MTTLSLEVGILAYVILSVLYVIQYLHYSMTTSMATACLTAQLAYAELQYLHKASKIWDIYLHPIFSCQKFTKVLYLPNYQHVRHFWFFIKEVAETFCFLCFCNNLELIFVLIYMKSQK